MNQRSRPGRQNIRAEPSLVLDQSEFRRACAVAHNLMAVGRAAIELHNLMIDRPLDPVPGAREALSHILEGLHKLVEIHGELFRSSFVPITAEASSKRSTGGQ